MSGSKIRAPIPHGWGLFTRREVDMIHQAGYVYHIKDEYFTKAQDDMLMQNKEGGNYRPTYYALKDETTSLQ